MRIGPYEVFDELGRGGMGRVLLARHVPTGVFRALKLLEGSIDEDLLARFRREAETQARVGGSGVVSVHEAGVERNTFWFSMDYMAAGSLRGRLDHEDRLPWRDAVALVASVARTLGRCHAAGVVHRDVKPDNILLDDEGAPRLADFGCVRDLAASRLTKTGTFIGTPAYMAPEQLMGQAAGPPADVFALALILHELLTGEPPFAKRDGTLMQLGLAIHDGKRRRPSSEGLCPPGVDALLDRALHHDPERRPPDGAAFAAELEALLRGERARPAPRPEARGRGRAVALGVLGALGIAALAVAAARAPRERASVANAAPAASAATPRPSPAPLVSSKPAASRVALETAQRLLKEADERATPRNILAALRAAREAGLEIPEVHRDELATTARILLGLRTDEEASAILLELAEIATPATRLDIVSMLVRRCRKAPELIPRVLARTLLLARDASAPSEVRRGAFAEAVSLLEEIARDPQSASPLVEEARRTVGLDASLEVNEVRILDELGDDGRAIAVGEPYAAALLAQDDKPYATALLTFLANVHNKRGEPRRALAALERVPLPPTVEFLLARAAARWRTGEKEGARADVSAAYAKALEEKAGSIAHDIAIGIGQSYGLDLEATERK